MSDDTTPSAFGPVAAGLTGTAGPDGIVIDLPERPEPKADTAPKRPTTRAGRQAAAAAKRAKAASKPDKKPASSKATPRRASLETRLTGNLVTLGTVIAATGGMTSPAVTADGVLICQHAPNVAAALDKIAKDDPRVAAALERMLTVGTWSGLVAAVLPLVLGIAANHGAIPAGVAGLLGGAPADPDTLAGLGLVPEPGAGAAFGG